jgi:transposase-like protein
VTACPKQLPADVWQVLELADLYRRGLPPVSGGSLDQGAGFVAACRQIWSDRAAFGCVDFD